MSSFDDFFATETPAPKAPAAFTKIAVPATEVSRDLFADLQTEAPPFQTGDEYLKAQVKAAKPSPRAKKDPINPPEKPAGVGLPARGIGTIQPTGAIQADLGTPIATYTPEPQGIGTSSPAADIPAAIKGASTKDILLSVADLLTKIANAT